MFWSLLFVNLIEAFIICMIAMFARECRNCKAPMYRGRVLTYEFCACRASKER